MSRYWIGVASRDHVKRAVEGGFCQLGHGKEAPVKRLSRGDRIVYYSAREQMKAGKPLKAFTAIGRVEDDEPHQVTQTAGFKPFRRKVHYFKAHDAAIEPLLEKLSCARCGNSWGLAMRRGLFQIEHDDYSLIAVAMGVAGAK